LRQRPPIKMTSDTTTSSYVSLDEPFSDMFQPFYGCFWPEQPRLPANCRLAIRSGSPEHHH
jgi:hypothetical protein